MSIGICEVGTDAVCTRSCAAFYIIVDAVGSRKRGVGVGVGPDGFMFRLSFLLLLLLPFFVYSTYIRILSDMYFFMSKHYIALSHSRRELLQLSQSVWLLFCHES